jgi:NTP pyrophosphatase (non-canonical NTP hydrolase)
MKLDDIFHEIADDLESIQENFDWYQNNFFTKRPPEFFCLELNGEAGELANDEKKLWKGRQVDPGRFGDEAADVMIALMNYANARGINLGEAVRLKLGKIEDKRKELEEKGEKY